MFARYYGADLGRFLSVDPVTVVRSRLTIPQRLNLYNYAANNPVVFVDPSGEKVKLARSFRKRLKKDSEFALGWEAFLSTDAGSSLFTKLDQDQDTTTVLRVKKDKHFDTNGDGQGDDFAHTEITKQNDETGDVEKQEIDVSEEHGGAEELADTLLDEFVHADQNEETQGQSSQDEDHDVKNELKETTDFDSQVEAHVEENRDD